MNYISTFWIAHLHRNARKQLFINFSVLGVSSMPFLPYPTRLNNSVHFGYLRVGCLMVVGWKEGRVVASSDFVWWHPTCVWQGRSGSLAGDRTPPSANTRGSISCQDSQGVHTFKRNLCKFCKPTYWQRFHRNSIRDTPSKIPHCYMTF